MTTASMTGAYYNTLVTTSQTGTGTAGSTAIVPAAKLFNPPYCPFYFVFCCCSLFSPCQGITVLWNSYSSFLLLLVLLAVVSVFPKTYSAAACPAGR